MTRTITQSDIDALRITVRFDALININEADGKNLGNTAGITITIVENDGTTTNFTEDTNPELRVRGKSRTPYSRDYKVNLRENARS